MGVAPDSAKRSVYYFIHVIYTTGPFRGVKVRQMWVLDSSSRRFSAVHYIGTTASRACLYRFQLCEQSFEWARLCKVKV